MNSERRCYGAGTSYVLLLFLVVWTVGGSSELMNSERHCYDAGTSYVLLLFLIAWTLGGSSEFVNSERRCYDAVTSTALSCGRKRSQKQSMTWNGHHTVPVTSCV